MHRWLALLLFIPLMLHAAPSGLTVESFKVNAKPRHDDGWWPHEGITAPWVRAADAKLASSINDRLFIAQFGTLAPKRAGGLPDEQAVVFVDGTTRQTFSVARNDHRVLAFLFETETCSPHCMTYQSALSFDSQTGRLLNTDQLFTTAGMNHLARRMRQEQKRQYQGALAGLRLEFETARQKREELQYVMARIEFTEECLREREHADRTGLSVSQTAGHHPIRHLRLGLLPNELVLTAGHCSSPAMRGLDDVEEVILKLPYTELRSHMTRNGRALLLDEGTTHWTDVFDGQLLRGHMNGKTAITMLLQRDSNRLVSGSYFYDQHGKAIALKGREEDGRIDLVETLPDGNGQATMALKLNGKVVSGTWADANGKRAGVVLNR